MYWKMLLLFIPKKRHGPEDAWREDYVRTEKREDVNITLLCIYIFLEKTVIYKYRFVCVFILHLYRAYKIF